MAVYVDPLFTCLVSAAWKWPQSCHLFADDLDELHAFAKSIGIKREWFQDKRLPHYDLNATRRLVAVRRGAMELGRRAATEKWAEIRAGHANS
jgi:hypothetical protein